MLVDDFDRGVRYAPGAHLHGVRDRQLNKEQARDPACVCQLRLDGRTLRCNNFVVFPYLDDVLAGDGGVFVLPGSHKALVQRPGGLFGAYGADERAMGGFTPEQQAQRLTDLPLRVPDGCVKPVFAAGDILLMPEATLHGVMPWTANGRRRRTFLLRYTEREGITWNGKKAEEPGERRAPPSWTARLGWPTLALMGHGDADIIETVAEMSSSEITEVIIARDGQQRSARL